MDLTKATRLFEELRAKIKEHGNYLRGSEFVTRILLIDPVLEMLGWDVREPDFVMLEHQSAETNRRKADYLLRIKDRAVAVVEAKAFGTRDLDGVVNREQADGYARYAEVDYFILTDGQVWVVHKPERRSPERLTPMVEFDIVENEPHECALSALSLWCPNLASDDGLIIPPGPVFPPGPPPPPPPAPPGPPGPDDDWRKLTELSQDRGDKKPSRIRFDGREIAWQGRKTWAGMFVHIADWLVTTGRLSQIDCPIRLTRRGRHYQVHHRNIPDFIKSREISGGFWVETNISGDTSVAFSIELLKRFGVDPGSVEVGFD